MSSLNDLINLDLSDTTEKIIAEYIWVGGSGLDLRSKARTLEGPVSDPSKLPKWNFDGSSTNQAPGDDSEVILYPQAIFKDPFRKGNNILVLCDAYTPAGEPLPTNKRNNAAKIFSHPDVAAEVPWYGIEQEYTLLKKDVNWPIGWPTGGFPGPQGPYYCGVGADKAFGRDIVDSHYKACLYAGINISGINGEVMPGQWEFQVGPAVGISAGDELWVARYILERITEIAGVVVTFDPKPIKGDWNGAGAHTNYSTKSMREEGGITVIKKAIEKLGLRHKEHISAYGEGNERRLTGQHETADINTFSWGVANRGASIRVGRDTEKEASFQHGSIHRHIHDRRDYHPVETLIVIPEENDCKMIQLAIYVLSNMLLFESTEKRTLHLIIMLFRCSSLLYQGVRSDFSLWLYFLLGFPLCVGSGRVGSGPDGLLLWFYDDPLFVSPIKLCFSFLWL
ncbi:Glutamine synthetase nodule isozyme [Linum perenne]